jgi:hypothetical protein
LQRRFFARIAAKACGPAGRLRGIGRKRERRKKRIGKKRERNAKETDREETQWKETQWKEARGIWVT